MVIPAHRARIGLFVCHCGHNIAGTVHVDELLARLASEADLVYAGDYAYMCSDPGQRLIGAKIAELDLEALVVASCSPRLHERTFRRVAHAAGINPYRVEIANIREHCAWIHPDRDQATSKAVRLARAAIAKARHSQDVDELRFPVTPAALVIGGGIAGMEAALAIADAGQRVYLVEREASIGGNMARLSETFPTLDCAQCTLTPKMVEVAQHANIELITAAEVATLEGYIGNFKATIVEHAKYVDWQRCTGCGTCVSKCPARSASSEFELGLGDRPAVFTPFAQAVPNKPTIDRESCLWFGPLTKKGTHRCGACAKLCETGAIDFYDQPRRRDLEVGAVVVATGYRTYALTKLPEYGGGLLPDVIDSLQMERLLSASGPTAGAVLRPSDGAPARSIAFIQCAGSRDQRHKAYCSKVCCMYTAKHALLFSQRVPASESWLFYIDLRHAGRDYEEFLVRTQQSGARFVRGKAVEVVAGGADDDERGKLVVVAEDTLTHQLLRVPVDLVVLATAMEPAAGVAELASRIKAPLTRDGFLAEAHAKLRPVESMTSGIFLAGAAQGPRDIPDTVAQAGAAASKVLALFSQPETSADPLVAVVDKGECIGCGNCIEMCLPGARTLAVSGGVVEVNAALCQGCGLCAPACPTRAADILGFSDNQLAAMIDALLIPAEGER